MKKIRLGRSRDNDVVINDNSVSRHHAEIVFDGLSYVIVDLDSLNGTYINGSKIRGSSALQPSDIVKLGSYLLPWRNYFKSDFVSGSVQSGSRGGSASVQASSPNYIPPVSVKKSSKPPAFLLMTVLAVVGFGTAYYFISRGGKSEKLPETIAKKYPDSKLPKSEEIVYDYSCMNSGGKSAGVINAGSEMDKEITQNIGVEVTQNEEIEEGKNTYNQLIEEGYEIVSNQRLDAIFSNLKNSFKPTYPSYKIFEIKMEDINAFTVGGYIFVSTELIRFVNNDDELAAVIGHEIFHNECGHIRRYLQKQKFANGILGDELGGFILGVTQMFTISFGQKDEVECDLHGLDICLRASYDPCAGVELWKRMKQTDSEKSELDNLFRSHPYGEVREGCNRNHLSTNYSINCK